MNPDHGCAGRSTWRVPLLLMGLGLALRAIPWLANYPLHRDEALYGYWARLIASGHDPLLLTSWIDKPPLVIYLIAASLRAFGVNEWALRLPGMVAGIFTIAATYALARRAYGHSRAWLAAALVTTSPFAILFAPTAFTDPWLALWLMAAAWAALGGQAFGAGLLLGLAVASKQQGVLGIPLVLGLLIISAPRPSVMRRLLFAVLGFALVLTPLTFWDSLRWSNRPSFWDRSLATYGGLGLAAPGQWPARAVEWGEQLGLLFGVPALGALMLLGAGAVGVRGIVRWANGRHAASDLQRDDRIDAALGVYSAGYLALHIMATFQVWDRYLLPLAPLICVLAARGATLAWDAITHRISPAFQNRAGPAGRLTRLLPIGPALLALALGYATWLGAAGRLPVGSDHGAYAGLDRVVATVQQEPIDTVVYHQSLGWYFDFYLFDAPQERRWWDSGWKLADDAFRTAQQMPERRQWVVFTAWETSAAEEARLALASKGLALAEPDCIRRSDGSRSFTLYRIVSAQEASAR